MTRGDVATLDCAFCRGRFRDFEKLAEHVSMYHVQDVPIRPTRCAARQVNEHLPKAKIPTELPEMHKPLATLRWRSGEEDLFEEYVTQKWNFTWAKFRRELFEHFEKEDIVGKTLEEMKSERGGGGPPLLHGSDVPKDKSSITVKVKELREAPSNFNAWGILDFEKPVLEKEGFALNRTNIHALAAKLGFDPPESADFDELAKRVRGKSVTLQVVMVNNPSSKKLVRSLTIV